MTKTATRPAMIATLVEITMTKVASVHRPLAETYTYKTDAGVLKFHGHPTKAWNWVVLENTVGADVARKIIDAACAAGFAPDELKTLKIKA